MLPRIRETCISCKRSVSRLHWRCPYCGCAFLAPAWRGTLRVMVLLVAPMLLAAGVWRLMAGITFPTVEAWRVVLVCCAFICLATPRDDAIIVYGFGFRHAQIGHYVASAMLTLLGGLLAVLAWCDALPMGVFIAGAVYCVFVFPWATRLPWQRLLGAALFVAAAC